MYYIFYSALFERSEINKYISILNFYWRLFNIHRENFLLEFIIKIMHISKNFM